MPHNLFRRPYAPRMNLQVVNLIVLVIIGIVLKVPRMKKLKLASFLLS